MGKSLLYFFGFCFFLILITGLFWPETKPASEPEPATVVTDSAATTTVPEVPEVEILEGDVVLKGTFLSLIWAETDRGKEYTYLLLDDGSEVQRIDLRPLIGSTQQDVTEKIGVERGAFVQIVGTMEKGEFRARSITPAVLQ